MKDMAAAPLATWAMGAIAGAVLLLTSQALYRLATAPRYHPVEITAGERMSEIFIRPLPPMDILVHVLGKEDFDREKPHVNTAAFTNPYVRPCEIYLKAGMLIVATAGEQRSGEFADRRDAHYVAHEIMHCIAGEWHVE